MGVFGMLTFFLTYVFKTILLMMGILWIWSEDAHPCETGARSFYDNASRYLFGSMVVYGFQLFFGTSFLIGCGLEHAVEEGLRKTFTPTRMSDGHEFDDDSDEEGKGLLETETRQKPGHLESEDAGGNTSVAEEEQIEGLPSKGSAQRIGEP